MSFMEEKTIKTYITYFDERQVEEYGLKEDENTVLFKGNDTSYSGESINHLNKFYCELCTMYYVWKNDLESDYVCFKQYRRPFDYGKAGRLPEVGEVITYNPIPCQSVIRSYAGYHGSNRAGNLLNVLLKKFGYRSPYFIYFVKSDVMYTNNTMLLNWQDFVGMCEFVFPVLFDIDKYYGLGFDYDKYLDNAYKYTEDGRYEYQTHWMAYIGERLVSCYIVNNLKAITVDRPEGNGFYAPYKRNDTYEKED